MAYSFGILEKGGRNLITDVPGITVGHCTLADGEVQTGVWDQETKIACEKAGILLL